MFKTSNVVAPKHPPHVALFQLTCILSAMEKKTSVFVLEAAVYSMIRSAP